MDLKLHESLRAGFFKRLDWRDNFLKDWIGVIIEGHQLEGHLKDWIGHLKDWIDN